MADEGETVSAPLRIGAPDGFRGIVSGVAAGSADRAASGTHHPARAGAAFLFAVATRGRYRDHRGAADGRAAGGGQAGRLHARPLCLARLRARPRASADGKETLQRAPAGWLRARPRRFRLASTMPTKFLPGWPAGFSRCRRRWGRWRRCARAPASASCMPSSPGRMRIWCPLRPRHRSAVPTGWSITNPCGRSGTSRRWRGSCSVSSKRNVPCCLTYEGAFDPRSPRRRLLEPFLEAGLFQQVLDVVEHRPW